MVSCERDGRSGKNCQIFRAYRQGHVRPDIRNGSIRAADELACIDSKHHWEILRKHVRGEYLGGRCRVDIAEASQVRIVLSFYSTSVVGNCSADSEISPFQYIHAQTLAGRQKCDVAILNVDDGPT